MCAGGGGAPFGKNSQIIPACTAHSFSHSTIFVPYSVLSCVWLNLVFGCGVTSFGKVGPHLEQVTAHLHGVDSDDGDDGDGGDSDDNDDDGGYPAYSHQSYSHQVGICHHDEGWEYDTVKFPPYT